MSAIYLIIALLFYSVFTNPYSAISGEDPANSEAITQDNSFQPVENRPSSNTSNLAGVVRITSSFEFWLSVIVLIFGSGVVFVQYILLKAARASPMDILRVFTVTLIVTGTLFAITAGFDVQTIAPAMGLFGSIAGYLLGRRSEADKAVTTDRPQTNGEVR